MRALREHLGLTQGQMAGELGTRQQTISDWETGVYRPRGTSRTILTIVAERAGFRYSTRTAAGEGESAGEGQDEGRPGS